MKIYIKILSLILCCFLLFTACSDETPADSDTVTGSDGVPSDGVGSDGINSDGTETAATEPDPTQPVEVKVAFIYNGSVREDAFNDSFEKARSEVMTLRGVTAFYMENVLVQQFDEAVQRCREEGAQVIVAASSHFATACEKAAKNETEGMKYISYGSLESASNMTSFAPALYQPVSVTGLVAAYNTVSNKIGMVIDNNAFHAKGIANAFSIGVKELPNASIEVGLNWALSSSNNDTKKAIDDFVAEGCDVIFLYQTSVYGILYCEQIGVKVIGYAYNMPELAPDNYLTGYYSNPRNYIIDNVRKAQYNNFRGNIVNQGLKYGYVGMVKLNEALCKEGTDLITDKYYQYVLDGKAAVFTGEIRDQDDKIRVDKGAVLNISQILSIDWLDKNIRSISNFSEPRQEDQLIRSDFTVYYTGIQ